MELICQNCGRKFFGRADKKFCSDKCRSLYNYYKIRSRRMVRLRVMSALERNYGILDNLIANGVETADVVSLEAMGFKVDSMTSFSRRGKLGEYWCYDIRYNITSGRLFNLRRPLELMRQLP